MAASTNAPHSATGTGNCFGTTRRRQARIEDVEWMATTGETLPGAAARLHIHPQSLRSSLARARRDDLVAKLLANQGVQHRAGTRAAARTVAGGGEAA